MRGKRRISVPSPASQHPMSVLRTRTIRRHFWTLSGRGATGKLDNVLGAIVFLARLTSFSPFRRSEIIARAVGC